MYNYITSVFYPITDHSAVYNASKYGTYVFLAKFAIYHILNILSDFISYYIFLILDQIKLWLVAPLVRASASILCHAERHSLEPQSSRENQ